MFWQTRLMSTSLTLWHYIQKIKSKKIIFIFCSRPPIVNQLLGNLFLFLISRFVNNCSRLSEFKREKWECEEKKDEYSSQLTNKRKTSSDWKMYPVLCDVLIEQTFYKYTRTYFNQFLLFFSVINICLKLYMLMLIDILIDIKHV